MNSLYKWFLLLVFSCSIVAAEEACKFTYTGLPEKLHNTVVTVPDEVVAMCEYFHVGNPGLINGSSGKASIFFVIDHSGSNYDGWADSDRMGSRFTVTTELIKLFKSLNPRIEVGLGVFRSELIYRASSDPQIVDCPGYVNGYIKLLELGTNYNSAIGNASGADILIHYLDTIVRSNANGNWVDLEYDYDVMGQTHINAGFEAARQAMADASNPKESQFVIFFSDGVDNMNVEWQDGVGMPTTFTVYLEGKVDIVNVAAKARLDTMTKNIRTNGYSTTNPKSNLWSIKTNHDTLMQLIVENVVPVIVMNISNFNPQDLTINSISPITGWDTTGFLFADMFPLYPTDNDFDVAIEYKVQKDSIDENGDTISTTFYDTTHEISFSVEIIPGAQPPDSVEITCWGRKLEFYYAGNAVSQITGDMDYLEIRFTEYEVDTLYYYKDVEVEITHTGGNPCDLETFELDDNGTCFSYSFPREIGTANSNDGTLQHQNPDSIVAVFRNPKLPLDTLRIAAPFFGIDDTLYALNKGIYFDNDADGEVDSIYLDISGKGLDKYLDDIMDNITLPAHRDFNVTGYEQVTGGIAVNVIEQASEILTYVTSDDYVEIADTIYLSADAYIIPGKINIIDSIAPVIMSASFVDSMKEGARDELTVTFSEDVKTIAKEKPFKYYSIDDDKVYDGTLSVISQSVTVGLFNVESLYGVSQIRNGDSIRIHWIYNANVYDELGNNQDNPENIRREITVKVVEKGMALDYAVYFDNDANGYIDSIFIAVTGKKVEEYVDDLVDVIVLPDFRKFTIDDYRYSSGGIACDVTEGNSSIITYITAEDVIAVEKEVVFNDGESVVKCQVTPVDSMAPVILSAHLIDSLETTARDELTVIFSENVETITPHKPLSFYSKAEDKTYDVSLNRKGQAANSGTFWVDEVTGVAMISKGDSVRINWIYSNNVYDEIGNNQDHPKNRRVELTVDKVPAGYDLIPEALLFDADKKYDLPDNFQSIPELQDVLDKTAIGSGEYQGITIITLAPDDMTRVTSLDSLWGRISIFDPLGNTLVHDEPMGFDKEKTRLVYIWDGSNVLNRTVGGSGYLAVMPCRYIYEGTVYGEWTKRKTVGVKK